MLDLLVGVIVVGTGVGFGVVVIGGAGVFDGGLGVGEPSYSQMPPLTSL